MDQVTRPGGCVAIIPARAGSKRLPGKNIRSFRGRPALSYPITAALASRLFDKVVVSTESQRIADIAIACGADVPFLRPVELADDHSGTVEVVKHAIEALQPMLCQRIKWVCCIYPAAMLVSAHQITEAFHRLQASPRFDYCVSVCRYAHPVQRALRFDRNGGLDPAQPNNIGMRSQDLTPHYFDAGQFYWGNSSAFLDKRPLLSTGSLPFVLERHMFVDIDTPADWSLAEALWLCARAEGRDTSVSAPSVAPSSVRGSETSLAEPHE